MLSIIACVLVFVLAIVGIFTTGFAIGDTYYTGYIYSTSTFWGRTSVEIRLGENAGEDRQPTICMTGEEAEKAIALTGSGTKVRIHLKPTPLHFKGLFGCDADTELEILEEE